MKRIFNDSEHWSYPSAVEHDGKLYVIYSATKVEYGQQCRCALLSVVPLDQI